MIFSSFGGAAAPTGRPTAALLGAVDIAHHVPGRLRLRPVAAAPDEATSEALCGALRRVPGVRSVSRHSLSGSIVVIYDPAVLSPGAVSATLCEAGAELASSRTPVGPFGEAAADRLFEFALERAAVALLAAVV